MPTRRDWYLGLFVIALAAILFVAIPRYEWREDPDRHLMLRIDRWTGIVVPGQVRADWGRWVSTAELRQDAERKRTLDKPPVRLSKQDINLPCPPVPPSDAKDPLAEIDRVLAEGCAANTRATK